MKVGRVPPADTSSSAIAVFRALRLGDMLCAVPALRALRAAWPRAHITLVGLDWAREFAARFSRYVDDFVAFPGYPGLPEQAPRPDLFPAFFAAMRRRRLDLAVQLHGSGVVTNDVVLAFGARRTAGFFERGRPCPDPDRFIPHPAGAPEVHRLLALPAALGAAPLGDALEFPLAAEDDAALADIEAGLRRGEYVCLHPGGRAAERRWPPARFAAVGDDLARRGFRVVLTGSTDERPVTRAVADAMESPAVDLAGRTRLGAVAALLNGARLLVSNDTGVAHLGVALRVPSVTLFDPGQVARWGPLDRVRHRVVTPAAAATPADVGAEVDELLAGEVANAR